MSEECGQHYSKQKQEKNLTRNLKIVILFNYHQDNQQLLFDKLIRFRFFF